MTKNAPMNILLPQPGQTNSYNPTFHPLPGKWAQEQLASGSSLYTQKSGLNTQNDTDLKKALAAERSQHEYWEQWQGVTPGKAVYENPRAFNETLQPRAKYGTEGPGYG